MINRISRRALAWALLATSALVAAPALAQQATTVPFPVRQYQDENGVDLLSGAFTAVSPSISIGGSQTGLNFVRAVRVAAFRDNLTWNISLSGTTYTVAIGTGSDAFTQSGSSFIPVEANGSSLTYNGATSTYTYTTSDGTIATFVQRPIAFTFGNATGLSVNTITYPNGKVLTYYYYEDSYVNGHGQTIFGRRLQAVTSNTGYMIHPAYASDDATVDLGGWPRMTQVKALNTSVDTCSPNDTSCPETGRPELDISPSVPITTYTDSVGRVTQYTSSSNGLAAIRLPGSTSDDITISYLNGNVSSVTRFGVTTNYSFVDNVNLRTVTVTRPGGSTRVVTFDTTKNVMLSDQNELGKSYSFQYDTNNRPTRVTMPEGNYTQLTYDARGNVTQLLRVPKTGSGLSNITLTAGYDTTCTNIVKCNQPNFTKDGKGNQTDYTYDTTHGGVLTVTRPAPATGAVRPQTRITYTRLGANGGASPTGVFMPTGVSECQTTASCTGVADEVKATIAYGQGLLPSSVSKGNGAGTLTATTAATYDVMGNLLAVDGPLSGTADTTAYRYNGDRELVGIISPDPDGAGTLKNRAVRVTYGSLGLISKEELGTTTGQTDTAWNAFVPAEAIDITYDANRHPTTQKLSSGNTAYALTQTSYDIRGRTDCVTQRMNPAIYGSLPASACTLGTVGGFGSDRIAKAVYDNASHVTQVQKAVSTSDAANERTLTYSNNGQLATLKDAENNLTTYVYDGFDRVSQTQFPSPTKGAGTSNASDYEQLTYDANSNVTSRRLRDATSIAFTYDNLDRVTLKNLPGGEPDVTYAYDNLNRLISASQTGNALSFTYDALSRNLTQVGPQGTATSAWDLAGRRIQLTYPGTGLYVNTDYLTTGEVQKIRENGATTGVGVLATYAYDNLGDRTSVTFGNGTSTSYAFDPVSRLSSLTNNLAGTVNDLTVGPIAYNPASQMTSAARTGDAYAFSGYVNVNRAYTSNGRNQYTAAGSATFIYDSNGNLTSDGSSAYCYSSENLLTRQAAASDGSCTAPTATLAYDPLIRLYQAAGTSTTRFAYDGLNMIADYDGSSVLQHRYVFGPGIDEPIVEYAGSGTTSRTFLSADERGSIIARTDSSGSLVTANSYDEYGIPGSANAGLFQYTGQSWISQLGTGLYYYKARFYSAFLGRFMQTDPIGYADNANLYAYVGNDPVNDADPSGLGGDDIVICGNCDWIPSNLLGSSGIGTPANAYQNNYSYSQAALVNGIGPRRPQQSERRDSVTCDPAGCDKGKIIISAAEQSTDEIVVTGSRLPIVQAAEPSGGHAVEYHLSKARIFHIYLLHASEFGVLAGKSQFNDAADIPILIYKAITRTAGHHQGNGNTAYVYDNSSPVGTYPDGTPTNYVTVITQHASGSPMGDIITAFPGVPGGI